MSKATQTSRKRGKAQPTTEADARPVLDRQWRTHDLAIGDNPLSYLDHEWLATNGTGAFAMGTVPGVNTRRYHGLLIAATRPPVGRVIALNQMLERIVLDKNGKQQTLELTACMFPGDEGETFVPQGHTMLRRFERGLSICWHYTWGKVEFVRELLLHWHEQAATLRYLVRGLGEAADHATLRLSPMLTLRDFHAMLHKADAGTINVEHHTEGVTVRRGELAATFACPQAARFQRGRDWWYNVRYAADAERGQEDREDYFVPGAFEVELDPAAEAHVVTVTVALGEEPADPQVALGDARQQHLSPILDVLTKRPASKSADAPAAESPFTGLDLGAIKRALTIAADDFVVQRTIKGQKLSTILAGYPWFADWGRDTFIALPGLLLETGRFDEAKATLRVFAESIHNGLVPNRFDDYDDQAAHYNTVDASLWFIQSALRYLYTTKDRDTWNEFLADACMSIMEAYIKGTDFAIAMAGDCLIDAGTPDTQLTWMDAKCGDTAFTPRHGKAIEINALWYSVLVGLAKTMGGDHRRTREHYKKLAARIKRSFVKVFWNDEHDCLIDHIWTDGEGNEHRDETIRPNQVFALSVPDSPIPLTRQRKVLKVLREMLLTPFGLRTLAADDPHYHGRYTGDQYHRDQAYHQGTVWAWLIGPYAQGVLRVGRFSDKARRDARDAIAPLLGHLTGPGVGQIAEIFEADKPHRPVGCPAQAWSVAEVLRVVRMIECAK